jgi:hypothetical protein
MACCTCQQQHVLQRSHIGLLVAADLGRADAKPAAVDGLLLATSPWPAVDAHHSSAVARRAAVASSAAAMCRSREPPTCVHSPGCLSALADAVTASGCQACTPASCHLPPRI